MLHTGPWDTLSPGAPFDAGSRQTTLVKIELVPETLVSTTCGDETANDPIHSPIDTTVAEGRALVFNHLLGELSATFMLLSGDAFRSLRAHLERHAKLGPTARREMREWLESARPSFTPLASRDEMHWIFYHTYFWACLEMGPVETDRHFARALRSAGELPEASRHRPQSFL